MKVSDVSFTTNIVMKEVFKMADNEVFWQMLASKQCVCAMVRSVWLHPNTARCTQMGPVVSIPPPGSSFKHWIPDPYTDDLMKEITGTFNAAEFVHRLYIENRDLYDELCRRMNLTPIKPVVVEPYY